MKMMADLVEERPRDDEIAHELNVPERLRKVGHHVIDDELDPSLLATPAGMIETATFSFGTISDH
jgi:hypothetical protein